MRPAFRVRKEIVRFGEMTVRPRRTCLVVPGSSPRKLEKARGVGGDEVIVDLEDGVAEAEKETAREAAARAAAELGALRVNARGTPWWEDDLRAAAKARVAVVVLPKVESLEDVAAAAKRLPPGTGLEAQIETARGLVEVEAIAAAGRRHGLEALVFGPADFAASVGVPVLTIGAGASDYALARIAVAARAFGLQAVDGPWAVLDDEAGLRAAARRALAHGYDGKWVIHPSQLAPVREVFTPSQEEVERAERLLAAAGAARDSGEMVDAASRRLAQALLARAGRP
jgi:citrate lyase subunit beta/citryl-CoA lyase